MKAPPRWRLAVLWICASLAVVFLIGSYAVALSRDAWPRGHPWHGIALLSMAVFFVLQTRFHRSGAALRVATMVLPLIAVGAMAAALATHAR